MKGTLLANTALFRGTSPQEAEAMLNCLGAMERGYARGSRSTIAEIMSLIWAWYSLAAY